ncbi:MAG: winged helix-turn-helix transcriptional regulator [Chloroflexi bacterium]|nr:winged helix-turn-helix transcriptional regulator [Chloroflexota bacterium]
MPIIPHDEIQLLHNNICQAVSDPKRIQILYALSDNPCNVTDLAALLNTPQPTISRHLAILRQRGIVNAERSGVTVTYSLANPLVLQILDLMRQLMRTVLEDQTGKLE